MKVNGNDLIVFFEVAGVWKTLAYATSCELDIQAETINVGSPDTGRWTRRKKRRLSWSGSSAHLMSDVMHEANWFSLLESSKTVKICFSTVEAHKLPIKYYEYARDGKVTITGDALINRVTLTGKQGSKTTLSVSFVGDGKLEPAFAPWILEDGVWGMNEVWKDMGIWNYGD